MAIENRQHSIDIKKLLFSKSRKITFIQTLRLLRLYLANQTESGENTKLFDAVRVRPELSLNFPDTDISKIKEITRGEKQKYRITATFLGIYGSSSPLPTFYTEDLIEERREGGSISRDFLDVFNESFYELFFSIWEKYDISHRLAENFDDPVYDKLFSLLGLEGKSSRHELKHSYQFLQFIGLATQSPRSAQGLRAVLRTMLSEPEVTIEQCVSYFADIDPGQQIRLGRKNHCLGDNSHLGSKVRDRMGKFRIHLGPLDSERFHKILPDKSAYKLLSECVQFYLDQPLFWDIDIQVEKEALQTTRPGDKQWGQLGWNTWLFSGDMAPEDGQIPLKGNA